MDGGERMDVTTESLFGGSPETLAGRIIGQSLKSIVGVDVFP